MCVFLYNNRKITQNYLLVCSKHRICGLQRRCASSSSMGWRSAEFTSSDIMNNFKVKILFILYKVWIQWNLLAQSHFGHQHFPLPLFYEDNTMVPASSFSRIPACKQNNLKKSKLKIYDAYYLRSFQLVYILLILMIWRKIIFNLCRFRKTVHRCEKFPFYFYLTCYRMLGNHNKFLAQSHLCDRKHIIYKQ